VGPNRAICFTLQRTLHFLSGTCGGDLWDSLGGKPLIDPNSVVNNAKNCDWRTKFKNSHINVKRYSEVLKWRDLVTRKYNVKAKNDMLDITIYYSVQLMIIFSKNIP
jgi:hypothetical protein